MSTKQEREDFNKRENEKHQTLKLCKKKESYIKMEKVATYVRISTENAIDGQTKKINDYCAEKGYTVCDSAFVIGDKKMALPMLKKLLDSAKENGVDKIVMASTNRIVGTVEELQEIKEAIEKAGVTIETLDGSYENGFDKKMLVASFLANAQKEMDE
jgi:DNA invertase Pin-like site-specific DNA recombinase